MQSYQNVSNSQPSNCTNIYLNSCKRLCKVIKMLAIHNLEGRVYTTRGVANAYAKLSKCQQFTTVSVKLYLYLMLQTLMQSYQNVSNSQRFNLLVHRQLCCKRLCKVIKMLAIHNVYASNNYTLIVANAYAKLSKCQQFTTVNRSIPNSSLLQTLLQSYQNVSNSQPNYQII